MITEEQRFGLVELVPGWVVVKESIELQTVLVILAKHKTTAILVKLIIQICCIWPFLFGVQPAYIGFFAMFTNFFCRVSRVLNKIDAKQFNLDRWDTLWVEERDV